MKITSQSILKIADDANNGLQDSLSSYIELKRIEKILSECLESVKPNAIAEANKYPQKVFDLNGAKVEKKKSAGRYDFSNIPQWNKAKENLKKIEDLAKQAHQVNKQGKTIIDEEGVVVESPKYREGDDTIAITIISDEHKVI